MTSDNKGKIPVVDDDYTICQIIGDMLTPEGYSVVIAEDKVDVVEESVR